MDKSLTEAATLASFGLREVGKCEEGTIVECIDPIEPWYAPAGIQRGELNLFVGLPLRERKSNLQLQMLLKHLKTGGSVVYHDLESCNLNAYRDSLTQRHDL